MKHLQAYRCTLSIDIIGVGPQILELYNSIGDILASKINKKVFLLQGSKVFSILNICVDTYFALRELFSATVYRENLLVKNTPT